MTFAFSAVAEGDGGSLFAITAKQDFQDSDDDVQHGLLLQQRGTCGPERATVTVRG